MSPQESSIDLVAIVGAGFMGTGIAESVAAAGVHVIVRDVDEAALELARTRIEHSVQRAVQRGKQTADEAAALSERLSLIHI